MDFGKRPTPDEIFGSFIPYRITPDTWVLSFMEGSEYIYLLEGENKALLIDTGWGAATLRPLVDSLTDKEIVVINTHFHPDHAGANAYFERVLVSRSYKLDEPSVVNAFGPFELNNMPYPNYEKVCVGTGDIIDLGGRIIDVYDAKPAHCNSSLFLYDRKQRMLFVGDEFEAGQVNLFDNSNNPDIKYDIRKCLNNFYDNAAFIKEMLPKTAYLMPNHNGAPMSPHYIDSFMELTEAIYSGKALIEDKLNHKYLERDPKAASLCRVRYKDVSVFLKKDLLMSVYGNSSSNDHNITLARVFSDGMVLQRDTNILIYGTAKKKCHIEIKLNDRLISEEDVDEGDFHIILPPLQAVCSGTLSVGDCVVKNVDIGEVWIAGGQSNMEFPLKFDMDPEALDIEKDEHLRVYTVGQYSYTGERDMGYKTQKHWDKWMCAGDERFEDVSALSYFVANELRSMGIPIGIINCSWGSTSASAWVSKESLECDEKLKIYTDEYKELCDKLNMPIYTHIKTGMRAMMNSEEGLKQMEFLMKDTVAPINPPEGFADTEEGIPGMPPFPKDMTCGPVEPFKLMMWGPGDQNEPGTLYTNMLSEISGYTNRGFIWYQGESDDIHADIYDRLFRLVINTWRNDWRKHNGHTKRQPFVFVQLAPLGIWNASTGDSFPIIRKKQQLIADDMDDVYMISNGDMGNVYDIHPKNKLNVAVRTALIIKKNIYDMQFDADAPVAVNAVISGDSIRISVKNGNGLSIRYNDESSYNGFSTDTIPTQYIPPVLEGINGLRIMADGAELKEASVTVEDGMISIKSEGISGSKNISIELGQTPFYRLNIYNKAGIVIFPFEFMIHNEQ